MQIAGASSKRISDSTNIDGRISAESVRVGRGRVDAHSVLAFKLLGLVACRSVTVLTSTAVLLVCNLLGLVACKSVAVLTSTVVLLVPLKNLLQHSFNLFRKPIRQAIP